MLILPKHPTRLNDGNKSMKLLEDLLTTLPDGNVIDVRIGLHWTTVVVNSNGIRYCGLASTIGLQHEHHGRSDVPDAGCLELQSATALSSLALSEPGALASVGVAAINALIPPFPELWEQGDAEQLIREIGIGKKVVVIGDFPFVSRLRHEISNLYVIDRKPHQGVFPESLAPEILPDSDIVAITGMSIINHTIESLLDLCYPKTKIIILGPSTPLSPVLFDHGVNFLCGSVVTDIDSVVHAAGQGATFRQLRKAGIQLVTMKNDWNE